MLRRKVAVRLRSGLRASDVVAAVGTDTFAVLLAWIEEADDAQRVADKLLRQAAAAAAAAQATGRGGFVNWHESLGRDRGAANDG